MRQTKECKQQNRIQKENYEKNEKREFGQDICFSSKAVCATNVKLSAIQIAFPNGEGLNFVLTKWQVHDHFLNH